MASWSCSPIAAVRWAAFDFKGNQLWRRSYTPWGEPYPFNKQHEPILYGDTVLNVEPLDGNPAEKSGWNYLRGIDKNTGKDAMGCG